MLPAHAPPEFQDRSTKTLIDGLRPAALLPIHCVAEDREAFLSLHNNCLMLSDGQRWKVG